MTTRLSDVVSEAEPPEIDDPEPYLQNANPSVRVEADPPERVCGVCPNPSSYSRKDVLGHVHRACTVHEPYLAGWVQDVAAEVASENRAAAKYESAAYGDRDSDY